MAFFEMALAAALAGHGAQDTPPFLVLQARFTANNARQTVTAATAVPNVPISSCYAWEIRIAPQNSDIELREVFELPAPAPNWGSDPSVTRVAPDRASAVTVIAESLSDGLLTHGWCVAEGDPIGPHRIIVYAGERALYEFRFNVVPADE